MTIPLAAVVCITLMGGLGVYLSDDVETLKLAITAVGSLVTGSAVGYEAGRRKTDERSKSII